jgi:hypothetical protein
MISYRSNAKNRVTAQPLTAYIVHEQPKVAHSQERLSMTKKSKPGVINTVVETISRPQGASIHEIVAILSRRFADREADKMAATARVQVSKHASRKQRDEKRGLVYFKKARKAAATRETTDAR